MAGTILCVAVTLGLLLMPLAASAQELEPGAYWPIPKGLNIVTVVNSFNWGDLAFDPAAPIDEANATIDTVAFSFARAFSLAGRSANVGVAVPVVTGHVEGLYLGDFTSVDRFGQGDPRLRFAMNLYGAPAMTPKEFASFNRRLILGASVTVAPPPWTIRFDEVDQPRHQSLVLQAGTWRVECPWPVGRGGDGWGVVVHGQHGLRWRTHADAGSDYRDAVPSDLQVQAQHVGGRGCQLLYGWADDDRREPEPRLPAQLAHRRHVFVSDRSRQAIRMSVSQGAYTTIGNDFTSIAASYSYVWTN